jgi:cytidylate kinase
VLEGRDIGTVVIPDAEAKFFVTASPEVRARRRYEELRERGANVTFEGTLREVVERDHADATRAVAPLVAAKDAELVDTSHMSIDAVVALIVERVRALSSR